MLPVSSKLCGPASVRNSVVRPYRMNSIDVPYSAIPTPVVARSVCVSVCVCVCVSVHNIGHSKV